MSSVHDEMEERVRDQLQAAAEELEKMPLASFKDRFDELFELEFDPERDLLDIMVIVDDDGIAGFDYQHLRRIGDEDQEKINSGREVELSPDDRMFGDSTVRVLHRPGRPFELERFGQELYNALVSLMASPAPSVYTIMGTRPLVLEEVADQPVDVFADRSTAE